MTQPWSFPARPAWSLCLALTLLALPAFAADLAIVRLGSDSIDWQPTAEAAGWVLTVTGPDGFTHRQEFADTPSMDLFTADGQFLADGLYSYELRAVPRISPQLRQELDAAADNLEQRQRLAARVRGSGGVQSGHFRIAQGALVTGDLVEPPSPAGGMTVPTGDWAVRQTLPEGGLEHLQVFNMDVLVNGSLCVGFDCGSFQTFGFDTLRLRENNLRIHFDDTSSVGSFPNNDWRLVANDSANGGANRFSIEDATTARTVFTLEAGAPDNSLYVDRGGRVGVGTSTPVLEAHVVDGDTPSLRLEQDASSGFTPQTWDVGANEVNFFVRDVTNGSTRPFRIRPGAPTDTLVLEADGTLGLGSPLPISEGGTGATDAATARANLGIEDDLTKAGVVPASAFSGNPATATVTFAEPFPASTSFVVLLTPVTNDGNKKLVVVNVLDRSATGFTVVRDPALGSADPLVEVGWLARPVGE